MTIEQEILGHLKAVQDSSVRNLRANDMTAYKVLACEEARLMDALRVIWKDRAETTETTTILLLDGPMKGHVVGPIPIDSLNITTTEYIEEGVDLAPPWHTRRHHHYSMAGHYLSSEDEQVNP